METDHLLDSSYLSGTTASPSGSAPTASPSGSAPSGSAPTASPSGSAPSSPEYCSTLETYRKSMDMAHKRITLTWQDVNVYAQAPPADRKSDKNHLVHILKDVSGSVQPGTMLALMGASGAGKSTLLNVLTQRNLGDKVVTGDLLVNGAAIGPAISSVSAYVQQNDLFFETLTVREHLWFQAMLRVDRSYTAQEIGFRVEELLNEFGLSKCASTAIGSLGGATGISSGEKRRLSFASEMLVNPALLFCDEPTSGLDSFMAENIISSLRRLAVQGRTIVCIIHQPSSHVFAMFDKLLLLADGGTAYMGPIKHAGPFFASTGYECPAAYNPADFYITQLAVVPGDEVRCRKRIMKLCEAYTDSPYCGMQLKQIAAAQEDAAAQMCFKLSLSKTAQYKARWSREMSCLLWRSWVTTVREPVLTRTRIIQNITVALVFGLMYLQQTHDQKGVMNINGALFLLQAQVSFSTMFAIINTFPTEFPIFQRDHENGVYRVSTYFISKLGAELPVFFLTVILFTSITYWMIGLKPTAEAFFVCLVTLIAMCFAATSYGYILSSTTSNVKVATANPPFIVLPVMVFGGFFLKESSIPIYFAWLKYLSWFKYGNEVLIVNQWKGVTNITCSHTGQSSPCFTEGQQIIDHFGYDESNIVLDLSLLLVLTILFRFVSFLLILVRTHRVGQLLGRLHRGVPKAQPLIGLQY